MGESQRRRTLFESERKIGIMIETVLEILRQSEADDYKILSVRTVSNEFFFVRHKLDMNRKKEVEHIHLTVFKKIDNGSFLGSSSCEIHPGMSREEIETAIKNLCVSASYVKNPIYSLNGADHREVEQKEKADAKKAVKEIIKAVKSCSESENETINSYEIFVNEKEVRILNSQGVDVSYSSLDSMCEIVVNAKNDDHEVELYRNYVFGQCDADYLKSEIEKTLQIGKDRLKAENTPNLKKGTVLLSGENVCTLMRYYIARCNTQNLYSRISDFELNEPIAKEEVKGDKITLTGCAALKNSGSNAAYDTDGHKITDRVLIHDNICCNFWGNQQFSQYVGKSEACIFSNFKVNGGSRSVEELKKQPHLEAVEFSDFQTDPSSGDFAGEIRLAYYYDGKKTVCVTGGSISGNIQDVQKNFLLSKELKQHNNMIVPDTVCMFDVNITGIEE